MLFPATPSVTISSISSSVVIHKLSVVAIKILREMF